MERLIKGTTRKICAVLENSSMSKQDQEKVMGYVQELCARLRDAEESRADMMESLLEILRDSQGRGIKEEWRKGKGGSRRSQAPGSEGVQTASGLSEIRVCVSAQGATSLKTSLRMISYARNGKNIFRGKEDGMFRKGEE